MSRDEIPTSWAAVVQVVVDKASTIFGIGGIIEIGLSFGIALTCWKDVINENVLYVLVIAALLLFAVLVVLQIKKPGALGGPPVPEIQNNVFRSIEVPNDVTKYGVLGGHVPSSEASERTDS